MLRDFAAFVINLDRSPDRLRTAADQLDRMELGWHRVRAIDATGLAGIPLAHYNTEQFERHIGRQVDPTEIALAFSHLKAIRSFLDCAAPFGLIFEDDFEILDKSELLEILAALARCPESWDLVRLSCSASRHPHPIAIGPLTGKHALAAPLMKFSCAAAYLINRRAAEALAAAMLPVVEPFDYLLDSPWLHDHTYRIVWPVPIRQFRRFGHTIDYSFRAAKPPAWRRHGALVRRIETGMRRFAYNSRRGFFVSPWVRHQSFRISRTAARVSVGGVQS